jgi:hypothetical protein
VTLWLRGVHVVRAPVCRRQVAPGWLLVRVVSDHP